jgi:hypothetical protein
LIKKYHPSYISGMPGIESISFIAKFPHGSQAVGTIMLGKTLKLTSMWQIVPIEDEFFFRWDEEEKPKKSSTISWCRGH